MITYLFHFVLMLVYRYLGIDSFALLYGFNAVNIAIFLDWNII